MNEDEFRYRNDTGRAATTALQREAHVLLVICAARRRRRLVGPPLMISWGVTEMLVNAIQNSETV
jgi:hypothetical protein